MGRSGHVPVRFATRHRGRALSPRRRRDGGSWSAPGLPWSSRHHWVRGGRKRWLGAPRSRPLSSAATSPNRFRRPLTAMAGSGMDADLLPVGGQGRVSCLLKMSLAARPVLNATTGRAVHLVITLRRAQRARTCRAAATTRTSALEGAPRACPPTPLGGRVVCGRGCSIRSRSPPRRASS